MAMGENVAFCMRCGKTWIVGDCIPFLCDKCAAEQRVEIEEMKKETKEAYRKGADEPKQEPSAVVKPVVRKLDLSET